MRYIIIFCLFSFYASAQSAFNSDRPGQSYSPISLEARQILVQQGFEFGATLLDSITTQRSTNYFTEVRVGLGGKRAWAMVISGLITRLPITNLIFNHHKTLG